VLDGGDLAGVGMPSGRRAFVDRMAAMMAEAAPAPSSAAEPASPEASMREELLAQHGTRLLLLQVQRGADGRDRYLAVIDDDSAALARERGRLAERVAPEGEAPAAVEVIDRATWETIERLTAAGLLRAGDGEARPLVQSTAQAAAEAEHQKRLARRARLLANAERKLRMALLLAQGGFADEAAPILAQSRELAAAADAALHGNGEDGAVHGNGEDGGVQMPAAAGEAGDDDLQVTAATVPPQALAGAIEQSLLDLRRGLQQAA